MLVHLKTLGCRLNEAELESWARDFARAGHSLTQDAAEADLLVVNTCAVTEEAVAKSRKLMRRSQRENPTAKLVMTGCYASLDQQQAAAELGVDLLVANPDKDRLVEITLDALALPAMPASALEPLDQPLLARNRQRAFIKVQDGCRHRCTYCIVTIARGEERSRDAQSIIGEINALHRDGIQEVVLAGVHLGGYGRDLGSNLAQLVREVLDGTQIPRIRLGSLEPWDLPEDFFALFDNPRLMPHLHLPLQSGADSVLRRMSRRCTRADFMQILAQARSVNSEFNITTDIIVGFPGETEDEWQQTLSALREAEFGHVHIFAFSPRQGTKAATLPDQVSREAKRQRVDELHELARQCSQPVLQHLVGSSQLVLVEGELQPQGEGFLCSGYTPNYVRVQFIAPQNPGNSLVQVIIQGFDQDNACLLGKAASKLD